MDYLTGYIKQKGVNLRGTQIYVVLINKKIFNSR